MPGATFTLITQNVDGLSPRAMNLVADRHPELAEECSAEAGKSLLEMHGRLFDVACTKCRHREFKLDSPVCPALAGTEDVFAKDAPEPQIDLKDLPRCTQCGALGRPGVVWFGEKPWHLKSIDKIVEDADLCIVVGTSSTVGTIQSDRLALAEGSSYTGISGRRVRVGGAGKRWEGRRL